MKELIERIIACAFKVHQNLGAGFLEIEDKVICEFKAAQTLMSEHETQLVNYLEATGIGTGALLDFGKSVTVRRKFREDRKPEMRRCLLPRTPVP